MHALNPLKKCPTRTVTLPNVQLLDAKRGAL